MSALDIHVKGCAGLTRRPAEVLAHRWNAPSVMSD